ncbi:hypothetical protein [Chromobacterium violaceum]|uniref:hypothetical protein n=1 Tax=Chromobacterium violaceum TaxID=536 RepID=UPI001056D4CC|nr:hypothetical protein [Chromobacterium violaceum]
MNKTLILAILLTLIAWPQAALPEIKKITTVGEVTCKDWISSQEHYHKDMSAGSGIERLANIAWLHGLITGLNANYPSKKNLLNSVDAQLIDDWVDSYCKKNSSSDVYNAANSLLINIDKIK